MSSRLDRLVSLLETGSSSAIRLTAAKQVAQLATKNISVDASLTSGEDTKSTIQYSSASSQADYDALMAVVARILPCLRSKKFETRAAASSALSQICTIVPAWTPYESSVSMSSNDETNPTPFPPVDLLQLMYNTPPLVASSGHEFTKPATSFKSVLDVKKAKSDAMKKLGLDFLDGVEDDVMDWEKELEDGASTVSSHHGTKTKEEAKVEPEEYPIPPLANESAIAPPITKTSVTPEPQASANLSARELNRLKRKRKGGAAAIIAPPSKPLQESRLASVSGRESSPKVRITASKVSSPGPGTPASHSPPSTPVDKFVVDPSKGGQVDAAKSNQLSLAKAIGFPEGAWPWDGVIRFLELDLFDPNWSTRHGAASAIRDILKPQGACGGMSSKLSLQDNQRAHEKWCNDLAGKVLCILVLDRFCDFSNDQSVSPVRETLAQTLASLFIHMPYRTLLHTHNILLQMAKQEFAFEGTGRPYIWQVRHGGMLGLKYEVAVRRDLLVDSPEEGTDNSNDIKMDHRSSSENLINKGKHEVLSSVVASAILGLGDSDDDVRSVAASTLLPVATDLVRSLPSEVPLVLAVLWDGLANMKDDLSSSVGAIMELLGKLAAFPEVISVLASPDKSRPLSSLAPILFLFFRHTIPNVRLQVVTTLHSFLLVDDLPKDWISSALLCHLFQNMMVEERGNIRDATLKLWKTALDILSNIENVLQATISSPLISDWYALMLQPWGQPLDESLFYRPSLREAHESNGHGKLPEQHNVDKAMLAQDASLVTTEVIWEARLACTHAMGYLISIWPNAVEADTIFRDLILHYLNSNSALQRVLAATVIEEAAREVHVSTHGSDRPVDNAMPKNIDTQFTQAISDILLSAMNQNTSIRYHEVIPNLRRLSAECAGLLSAFETCSIISPSQIPRLPLDIDSKGYGTFDISVAEHISGTLFIELYGQLKGMKKKELATFDSKRATILSSIDLCKKFKERYDIRVLASCAAAVVALCAVPSKVGTVVKNLMNGVKFEESIVFQIRFSTALSSMVDFGLSSLNATVPITKVVKNLCAFLCSDPNQTPSFTPSSRTIAGILSFKDFMASHKGSNEEKEVSDESVKARISRRGAEMALVQLSRRFGANLFEVVPMIWESTTEGLLSTCKSGSTQEADILMEKQTGQDLIDSLVTLQTVVPALHPDLWSRVLRLLSPMRLLLGSRFATVRQSSARCLATICNVITVEAMRCVIEDVLPLLGDATSVTNRQGAMEAIFHIVNILDSKTLPYVIFLIVPVLGRMSDADEDIRSTATNTFASLVKMVPLEAGLPAPEGFPPELLERRDKERQFLTQLLDGSKVEEYSIPVKINAELRKYQQDGVNWLAFLAKYQLHGILCDDMGLGKTLQSICILASKYFERVTAYNSTKSPEFAHLPSLIVCPPTLTGHWFYEIRKYAENLNPILFAGPAKDRARMLSQLANYNVVITSYEVVRNDIQNLSKIDWLYCILDEGHIIKNGKTKLTKAVKLIRSQHRLILSGTPIQNNVLELWSLFDFLMPGFLGTEQSFNERFGKPILANRDQKANSKTNEAAALALEALHKQVLPFLLRRLKEDVLNDLPPKIIQDYYCELSDLQKQLYDDFAESQAFHQTQAAVQTSEGSQGQKHVFQSLQYLKKLCNHPALVLKEDSQVTKDVLAKFRRHADDASPLRDLRHAPKLQALRQLLIDCGIAASNGVLGDDRKLNDDDMENGGSFTQHRVLIFCQMKQMLDIIESDLFKAHMPSVTYMRLDGSTDTSKRHAIVQTFNSDPSIDCLLLTTHVGGLGLTLTGADTVIFVEHDWNPMKDLQAMDRAHRIGQKKVVNVYRLITKDTLEERIMGLQRFKLNIANSVITQQNSGLSSMSTDLVLDLFKRTPAQDDSSVAKRKDVDAPVGQKSVLAGLEDLPAEEEYEGLDLAGFIGSN